MPATALPWQTLYAVPGEISAGAVATTALVTGAAAFLAADLYNQVQGHNRNVAAANFENHIFQTPTPAQIANNPQLRELVAKNPDLARLAEAKARYDKGGLSPEDQQLFLSNLDSLPADVRKQFYQLSADARSQLSADARSAPATGQTSGPPQAKTGTTVNMTQDELDEHLRKQAAEQATLQTQLLQAQVKQAQEGGGASPPPPSGGGGWFKRAIKTVARKAATLTGLRVIGNFAKGFIRRSFPVVGQGSAKLIDMDLRAQAASTLPGRIANRVGQGFGLANLARGAWDVGNHYTSRALNSLGWRGLESEHRDKKRGVEEASRGVVGSVPDTPGVQQLITFDTALFDLVPRQTRLAPQPTLIDAGKVVYQWGKDFGIAAYEWGNTLVHSMPDSSTAQPKSKYNIKIDPRIRSEADPATPSDRNRKVAASMERRRHNLSNLNPDINHANAQVASATPPASSAKSRPTVTPGTTGMMG